VPAAPSAPEVPPTLTGQEKRDLAKLEMSIDEHLGGFLAIGRALLEISRRRLYRETHSDFETYVEERWSTSPSAAYRAMKAAEIHEQVSPIGEKLGLRLTAESQFRPLAPLQPKEREEVLRAVAKRVKKDADGQRHCTAKMLAEVASEVKAPRPARTNGQALPADTELCGKCGWPAQDATPLEPQKSSSTAKTAAAGRGENVLPSTVHDSEEDLHLWNGRPRPWASRLPNVRAYLVTIRAPEAMAEDVREFARDLFGLLHSIANELADEYDLESCLVLATDGKTRPR